MTKSLLTTNGIARINGRLVPDIQNVFVRTID